LLLVAIAVPAALLADGGDSPTGPATAEAGKAPEPLARKKTGRRVVVWAVGDAANGSSTARAVGRMIAADRPDRLLYLGDVYPDGTASDFRRNYVPAFGALKRITLPTPGNHDWPNHEQGYDPYWDGLAGGRLARDHYAVRMAGWQLISLNSQSAHDAGSKQVRWLKQRVARGGNCRIAFWHRPLKSAGSHGDQDDIGPLWEPLAERARLVINGHEHNMQRLRRVDGIVPLISGAGGGSHYEVNRSDRRLVFADTQRSGALRLVLRPRRVRWKFITTAGKVLDRGRLGCRPPRR
jgi:Calcineurin-like phosphoesterase